MGQIPPNFCSSIAPKLMVGSEKVCGCKKGMDMLYLHAKFGCMAVGDGKVQFSVCLHVCHACT